VLLQAQLGQTALIGKAMGKQRKELTSFISLWPLLQLFGDVIEELCMLVYHSENIVHVIAELGHVDAEFYKLVVLG
jgi:hypothetical protein